MQYRYLPGTAIPIGTAIRKKCGPTAHTFSCFWTLFGFKCLNVKKEARGPALQQIACACVCASAANSLAEPKPHTCQGRACRLPGPPTTPRVRMTSNSLIIVSRSVLLLPLLLGQAQAGGKSSHGTYGAQEMNEHCVQGLPPQQNRCPMHEVPHPDHAKGPSIHSNKSIPYRVGYGVLRGIL